MEREPTECYQCGSVFLHDPEVTGHYDYVNGMNNIEFWHTYKMECKECGYKNEYSLYQRTIGQTTEIERSWH